MNNENINENEIISDVQNTEYTGVYLGCKKQEYKDKPGQYYGTVSLYFTGVKTMGVDAGQPWFSVQNQFMSVENMETLTKGIPFGSKVKAIYTCGNTPGGRQRVSKLELV